MTSRSTSFLIVCAVAALLTACGEQPTRASTDEFQEPPRRIVSMAPSTTEILFALGLGDRVVGVTRFCEYPPEAQSKRQVGGFLDPNYETILALNPDLVVLLPVHGDTKHRIEDLGIPTLAADHRTLDGILASIREISEVCGAMPQAERLIEDIQTRMAKIQARTQDRPRPRVLISAGRALGTGRLQEVYAAGQGQWYDDIIELAGARNAYQQEGVMFPALSGEGLLRLNPDVIIEMAPELDKNGLTPQDVVDDWTGLDAMKAVRNGRVHVLTGDYVTIPGPRFVQIIEDVARIVHPEAFESAP